METFSFLTTAKTTAMTASTARECWNIVTLDPPHKQLQMDGGPTHRARRLPGAAEVNRRARSLQYVLNVAYLRMEEISSASLTVMMGRSWSAA
ncbi:hypothetical protein CE91St41_27500 [Oscillospiraceae bacterium]|nr:hypothetical protein CE91St40_10040 [Oscillospiraceae bacterium]BDF75861.1 hypothetical protein CE91St41_27500 [Oscillospiraceae bacterium]